MSIWQYLLVAGLILFTICGLMAQSEIEAENEQRRKDRLKFREETHEEMEKINFISSLW